jgi:hypothetical protein
MVIVGGIYLRLYIELGIRVDTFLPTLTPTPQPWVLHLKKPWSHCSFIHVYVFGIRLLARSFPCSIKSTPKGAGLCQAAAPLNPQSQNLKNTDSVDVMISEVLCELPFR